MGNKQVWQCPYCAHHQVLSEYQDWESIEVIQNIVQISEHNRIGLFVESIACLNTECKKLTLKVKLLQSDFSFSHKRLDHEKLIKQWSLLPDSIAKPQPDYIPESIREDYEEACKIAHLSPKASAVLARRCLETMIKDFCKIREDTLHKSIEKLKVKLENNQAPQGVTDETMEAIDSIRKMGNVGAHMKEKIGILIDIDPEEATLLIELIEMLFKDWYVAQYERQQRLNKIKKISQEKKQSKVEDKKDLRK